MNTLDGPENERIWAAARALDEEWAWMGVTLVTFILCSGSEGLSLGRYVRECWENDLASAYRMVEAIEYAAEAAGLELPWRPELCDGDVRLVVTDREAAAELHVALNYIPRMGFELELLT